MNEVYLDKDGTTIGPFSLAEVRRLLQAGEVTVETLYARPGAVEWAPVSLLVPLLTGEQESRAPMADGVQAAKPPRRPTTWTIFGGRKWWCPNCYALAVPKRIVRGSLAMEVALWIGGVMLAPVTLFVTLAVPLLYSLSRQFGRIRICPACHCAGVIHPKSKRYRTQSEHCA